MTICVLFLCAATVNSKHSSETKAIAAADPFALKNPNAFDPARRRSVRALKIPRETAAHMASGIDAAEEAVPAEADTIDAAPSVPPRVAEANR
ncbi:MAG: hypothetical protein Q7T86_06220 [Hyphomicrobiaceae bacterium]|nr:hypothetical protein [Hyphomicrobiaceae bacterium]